MENTQYAQFKENQIFIKPWLSASVLFLFSALSLVDRYSMSIIIPEIKRDLFLTDVQISLLQSLSFAIFYGVFGLLIGYTADIFSKKLIIYLSITVWSIASMATGLSVNYWQMFVARMMIGAGEGGVSPASQSLISALFPKNKVSLPMSLFQAFASVGIGLSFLLTGWLLERLTITSLPGAIGTLAPWRQVLVVLSTPGIILAFLAFTITDPSSNTARKDRKSVSWHRFIKFVRENSNLFMRLLMGYGLTAVIASATFSWGATYARRVLGASPSETGGELGAISVFGGIIGPLVAGLVIDRQFSRGKIDFVLRLYSAAAVVSLPLGVIGFLSDRTAPFLVGTAAIQCVFGAAFGPGMAALQIVTPAQMRGRIAALMVIVISIGGYGMGPVLVGALTDYVFRDPSDVGYSIATVIAVAGPLSTWLIWSARGQFAQRVRESRD